MTAAEDATEVLRLAREALAMAEAAAVAAGVTVAGHVGEDPGVRPDDGCGWPRRPTDPSA